MNKAPYFVIALAIVLACSVALTVYFYTQYESAKPSSDEVAFNSEFGNVLIGSPDYDFSLPITMYHALRIALESGDWNATSLENMTVTVSLDYMEFTNSSYSRGSQTYEVTQPAQTILAFKLIAQQLTGTFGV
jgi:hypothetical protein